jgi:hypothetical protein
MSQTDYDFWKASIRGDRPETTPGTPHCGFYRDSNKRAVAIWREDGEYVCQVTSGYTPRHLDEIDGLFGFVCRSPITRDVYLAKQRGEPWPEQVATIAIQGHNNPPEDEQPATPDAALLAEIEAHAKAVVEWLETLPDRKPVTQAEADKCENYALEFGRLENKATALHKEEKAPHLETCRQIDARWFGPVRDKAAALKVKIRAIGLDWLRAENKRREQAAYEANRLARIEHEKAQASAAHEAVVFNAPPPAPEPFQETKAAPATVGTVRVTHKARKVTTYEVDDLPAACAFFATQDEVADELVKTIATLAKRAGAAGITVPGVRKVEA